MVTFYIKQDDTLPAIQAVLKDAEETIVDLTGATVMFIMTPKSSDVGDTPKVEAAATVVDAVGGVVRYSWVTGDTDTAERYRAEFEVTFSGGDVETFPNSSYLEVKVTGDLGGSV